MSINDSIGNSTIGSTAPAEGTAEPGVSQGVGIDQEQPAKGSSAFATRANKSGSEGLSKGKLLLLGGGLAVAVLFFIITAIAGHTPKKQIAEKPQTQQQKQAEAKPAKGSVTPVMEAVRTAAPDNAAGQLGPGDIRRTRALTGSTALKSNSDATENPATAKPRAGRTLASVPTFEDTQQKWEDPTPYGEASNQPTTQSQQQNTLKEPSLVFVRSVTQSSAGTVSNASASGDATPRLDLTPGTRIEAKLETQISSAVLTPVVAVVEYTYAIGDKIILPAGARVYGSLQQADRSGLVSVKFEEVELLDGARVKIEAVGTGLDLGPIKGNVYGKNTGKNFLVRAASGIGSDRLPLPHSTHHSKSQSQSGGIPCAYPLAVSARSQPVMPWPRPPPFPASTPNRMASPPNANPRLTSSMADCATLTNSDRPSTPRLHARFEGPVASSGPSISQPNAAILPTLRRFDRVLEPGYKHRTSERSGRMYATFCVSRETADRFIKLFVNRRAYGMQAVHPLPNGSVPYYLARDWQTKKPKPLDAGVVRMHLNGDITINLYAINPETQRSKWVAIDADFDGAVEALFQLQWELKQDGVEAALEQSRRGGHLWIFAETPLLAAECRIYIYNLALRLGVPVKGGGLKDGIEVFPRQDRIEDGEYGSAIRAPIGVHRRTNQRYWFYEAALTPEAQLDYLDSLKKLTEAELRTFIHGMTLPEAYRPVVALPYIPPASSSLHTEFRILDLVRTTRKDSRNWWARCPSCAQAGHDRTGDNLAIQIKNPRLYKCWAGCTKEEIRAALGQPIRCKVAV